MNCAPPATTVVMGFPGEQERSPWMAVQRPDAGRGLRGAKAPVDGVQGRAKSPREGSNGDTFEWRGKAQCLTRATAGGMQRGRASGTPCQDGVVLPRTSCEQH